ncbi:MAG: hypothetical protein ACRCVN_03305 [Spirochaetia bacterium]
MATIFSLIAGLIGTFFAGIFVYKAQINAQQLNKINKIGKEYEKIDAHRDDRSDIDVLRKHKP